MPVPSLQSYGAAAGRWLQRHGALAQAAGLLRHLLERIRGDDCARSAAMLAYVTLLAIVPLLTIGFSVFAAFPVFEGVTDRLRELLVENLVPAASEVVDDYLKAFIDRAAELTAVGIVGLAVSALLLLNTIERVLNGIWAVARPRPPLQRLMVYWTVLTIGPLLLGVSLVASSYMGTVSLGPLEPPSAVVAGVLSLAPFVVQAVVFTLVYSLVPHRGVPVRHAAVGGVVASLLFELAKAGFAQFIARAPTYEAVYGALAALPIFLVWLYISWWVVLLGAELTRALEGYRRGDEPAQRWALLRAVRLLGRLYEGQRRGETPTTEALRRREPRIGEAQLRAALEQLQGARIVDRTAEGGWILRRDASTFTLAELQEVLAYPLPPLAELGAPRDAWERRLADCLRPVEERWRSSLDRPLSELLGPAAEGDE